MAGDKGRKSPGLPEPSPGQILIYKDAGVSLQVRMDGQTVWLTQLQMAELFQTTPQNITLHIQSIYEEKEQVPEATCKEYLQVRQEGELQARGHRPMYMREWISKLDDFLRLSERDVLTRAGKISHALAEEHAYTQFAQYEEHRRQIESTQSVSDFDQTVEQIKKLGDAKPKRVRKRPAG